MKHEIKPCKCGRTPHVKRYEWPWGPDTFGMVCDCGFEAYKFFVSPNRAIEHWNTMYAVLPTEVVNEMLEREAIQ